MSQLKRIKFQEKRSVRSTFITSNKITNLSYNNTVSVAVGVEFSHVVKVSLVAVNVVVVIGSSPHMVLPLIVIEVMILSL